MAVPRILGAPLARAWAAWVSLRLRTYRIRERPVEMEKARVKWKGVTPTLPATSSRDRISGRWLSIYQRAFSTVFMPIPVKHRHIVAFLQGVELIGFVVSEIPPKGPGVRHDGAPRKVAME